MTLKYLLKYHYPSLVAVVFHSISSRCVSVSATSLTSKQFKRSDRLRTGACAHGTQPHIFKHHLLQLCRKEQPCYPTTVNCRFRLLFQREYTSTKLTHGGGVSHYFRLDEMYRHWQCSIIRYACTTPIAARSSMHIHLMTYAYVNRTYSKQSYVV